MLSEFDLIKKYFDQPLPDDANIALGIGDDCALLSPNVGMQLAISCDMLVSGRHFFPDADPYFLGHKSLAVNLSDLAAMGAKPLAFTLALSLPEANPDWLEPFSRGLFELAHQHQCRLIGGDTTKGPLNICITVFGELPIGSALKRSAAKVDDDIWVSGQLGDARLALNAYLNEIELTSDQLSIASQRLHRPSPRIALGLAIRDIAHAALDVSDGLIGDLAHILKASQVGASLMVDQLPIGDMLQQQSLQTQREISLAGGDDYELCFTTPVHARELIIAAGIASKTQVTRIGKVEAQSGLRLLDNNLQTLNLKLHSFDHFTAP